jgi:glucose-1-phosphate thymidylyltransferase
MCGMKTLVLAAHQPGRPPWPSFGSGCRYLFPVANDPILRHVLRSVRLADLTDATVVVEGENLTAVRTLLHDGTTVGLHLDYAECAEDAALAAALSTLPADLGDEPVLVLHGDALLEHGLATHVQVFAATGADALALRVPAGSGAHADRTLDAGWLLGPRAVAALRTHGAGASTDPVSVLQEFGLRVEAVEVDGCLACHGPHDGLLEGNRRALSALTREVDPASLQDCEIVGPVIIHPSARLESTVVRGPAIVGPRARLTNTYIGPYTSIGADVVIDGTEIEHSIVLPRATLGFVGTRLEESIIGRGARVGRRFRMPSALRLTVGEDAKVAFS